MNVFVLDRKHEERARYHCDTHVNKMLLEAVQILNTAARESSATSTGSFYQKTHTNHPWCKWARERYANWEWLLEHAQALHQEFQRRNDKEHKSGVQMYEAWVETEDGRDPVGRINLCSQLPDGHRTTFPLAMPDEYAQYDDRVRSYREYYVGEKVPQDWCTWSTDVPNWVLSMQ